MAPDSPMVEAIAKKYGKEYKTVSVFIKSSFADRYISDLNPFEWAVLLKEASMVITSYFHGTLLSLIQGTPTLVLDYSGYCDEQYEGKLKDLMITRFHFPELYYDKAKAVNFTADDSFYKKTDAMLHDEYQERIDRAVQNERETAADFMNLVKSADYERK